MVLNQVSKALLLALKRASSWSYISEASFPLLRVGGSGVGESARMRRPRRAWDDVVEPARLASSMWLSRLWGMIAGLPLAGLLVSSIVLWAVRA